jgi:hypothetical protein
MPNIERRVERLEAASPSDDEVAVITVQMKPWCLQGRHPLPYGHLRGYGDIRREKGESEEQLYDRAVASAMQQRGPGCGIVLVEDRENVKCAEHPDGRT